MLGREIAKYSVFGVMSGMVNIGSFITIIKLYGSNYYLLINVVSFLIATLFAFVVNRRFVFKSCINSKKSVFKEIALFFSSRVLFFSVIEELGIFLMVSMFSANSTVSKVFLSLSASVANFIFSKFIVFRRKVSSN